MKIQKFQKGKVVLNTFDALADLVKNGDLKLKRERIITNKPKPTVKEYVSTTKLADTKGTDTSLKDRQIKGWIDNNFKAKYGVTPEPWMHSAYTNILTQHPYLMPAGDDVLWYIHKHRDLKAPNGKSLWFSQKLGDAYRAKVMSPITQTPYKSMQQVLDIPDYFTPEQYKWIAKLDAPAAIPQYSTSPVVLNIPDYFKPQQYRGIGNYDTMFENAQHVYLSGAPEAAQQFLSAGMKDVAAMARGLKPTSFKYKPAPGIVPMPVLQEIVTRRGAPAGTAQWLHNINLQDPTIGTSYLDLFAKRPNYFRQMYNLNGTPIK